MKRFIISAAIIVASMTPAKAQNIALWTFETSLPNGVTTAGVPFGPIAPEVGTGQAFTLHAASSTVSNPVGNGSAESFSSTAWAIGDYYQFSASTVGFSNIGFQWDHTSSNTGPRDFQLHYTTDGSAYTSFGPLSVILPNAAPNPVWNSTTSSPIYTYSADLSSIPALNNNPNAGFRIIQMTDVSANGGTVAATGTSRVDNVIIFPVPEPTTILAFSAGALVVGNWVRRRRSK